MIRASEHFRANTRRRVRADVAYRRRAFLLSAAAWPAFAWAGIAGAQTKQKPVVIGWLAPGYRATARSLEPFKEQMKVLGWKEGAQYVLEERWAEAQVSRLPTLADELNAKKPSVIVAILPSAVIAAAKAAPTVPIVQAQGESPVTYGLAVSLARPGGMVTGVTNVVGEVSEKYLELLLMAVPDLKRVGFLVDASGTARFENIEKARRSAMRFAIEPRFAEAARAGEVDRAISDLAHERVQGLVILPSAWFTPERRRIMRLALAQRWPVVAGPSSFAEEGALLAYSADAMVNFRRVAYYVDRILKGAKPGDLPIEQPTKFNLIVNAKTAKALGITIPQSILLQAERVIE
jgi:putative ABC transport system substrate-binding protein